MFPCVWFRRAKEEYKAQRAEILKKSSKARSVITGEKATAATSEWVHNFPDFNLLGSSMQFYLVCLSVCLAREVGGSNPEEPKNVFLFWEFSFSYMFTRVQAQPSLSRHICSFCSV